METRNRNNYNIIIVDDVPANLKVLSEILKREGYKVRPIPTGKMALQAAAKDKPDLFLLDIMMPGMDGYEVCRLLKEDKDLMDVPVIFISALSETEDIVKAFTMGGVDYITKPFQQEEVKARVSTHLKIRKLSKELQELNASKDKFFSIIAHDLKSPFSGFLGFTQMMSVELKSMTMEQIQKYLVMMGESASNLYRLLENLLQWARLQRGLIEINLEKIRLFQMIEEILILITMQITNKNIYITVDVSEDIEVFADINIIQTVIRNILSNAVKFTQRNGKIVILAKQMENDFVELSISDSGIGMNQNLLNNLFRIDVNTGRKGTENEPSTGLGLILCKDLIEKQGGKLWVESKEGFGSTFYFTIPIR